jgi:LacI family transcriptional regulator
MTRFASDLQITLQDVADLAEVHRSTASRALDPIQSRRISPATVARVRAAADRLGYTPDLVAAGLKRGSNKSVGVVVSDLDNPYNGLLIRGLSAALDEHGFVAFVTESVEDPNRLERVLEHLIGRRVDAIVMTAAWLSDAALLQRVARSSTPVVLGVGNIPGSGLAAVLHDDRAGGALAARHFHGLGHRSLAQLLGPLGIDTFVCRRDGFRGVLDEHPELVDATIAATATRPTLDEGRRMMELLLEQPRDRLPTAVFAHNDLMAVGALEALAAAGLECPRDVSLIGYNDIPLVGALSPPLTTVRLPSLEVGRRIGEMVLSMLADPGAPPEPAMLAAELVVRSSTGPPRAAPGGPDGGTAVRAG